jgi:Family of unknown function (DUF5985)
MTVLLSGMLTAGYLIAGVHFLKFRQRTGDRLFLIFGLAFWVLALQRAALTLVSDLSGAEIYLYGLRVVAFLLIIGAIVDKNRKPSSTSR